MQTPSLHMIYMILSAIVIAWLMLALGSVKLMLTVVSTFALICLLCHLTLGHSQSGLMSKMHVLYMIISAFILLWLLLLIFMGNFDYLSDTLVGSYNHLIFMIIVFIIFLSYMIFKHR